MLQSGAGGLGGEDEDVPAGGWGDMGGVSFVDDDDDSDSEDDDDEDDLEGLTFGDLPVSEEDMKVRRR